MKNLNNTKLEELSTKTFVLFILNEYRKGSIAIDDKLEQEVLEEKITQTITAVAQSNLSEDENK